MSSTSARRTPSPRLVAPVLNDSTARAWAPAARFRAGSASFNSARLTSSRASHRATADGTRVITAPEPTEAGVNRVLRVWDRSGAEPVVIAGVRARHAAAVTGLIVVAVGSVHLRRIPAAP